MTYSNKIEHSKCGVMMLVLLMVFVTIPTGSMSTLWGELAETVLKLELNFSMSSVMFAATVVIVTTMILVFSRFYMSHSPNPVIFLQFLTLFVMSMILLLIANDWLMIILAWEGLGITSFYLVSFYSSWVSHEGAIITMLSNRIGDITLIFSLITMLIYNTQMEMISLMLIMSVSLTMMTKSAQFPIMSWLPAAMAAPTPISSLVHSSTLVTAGLILWLKLSWAPLSSAMAMSIGVMTLLSGSWAAMMEKDFKRIVAFSTLSQLGMILTSMSLITPLISWFHLSSHALFKSALFVWVGVMIMNSSSNQNNSIFGANSMESSSWSSWSMIILFNLTALPVSTGFLSKESFAAHLMTLIFLLAVSMTLIYSWRMFKTANKINNLKMNQSMMPNIPLLNTLPLLVFGIMWTMNISIPTLPPTFWLLALLTISVWVWIIKMNSMIFYKITNSVKLTIKSCSFNEKWLYQWSWNSLATKQIMIAAIAVLVTIM